MNILLIITDQQRGEALGFLDGSYVTPHLDALAARGTAYTRCVSPSPICGPARTAMFTGRYPHQARGEMDGDPLALGNRPRGDMVLNDYSLREPPRLTTKLGAAGYATSYAGKWHLGNDVIGDWFERHAGERNADYVTWLEQRGLPAEGWPLNDPEVRSKRVPPMSIPRAKVSPLQPLETNDAWIADIAMEQIRTRARGKPFFQVCSFNGPHPPLVVPEPYHGMVDRRAMVEPGNFRPGPGEPECKGRSFYRRMWEDQGGDWEDWRESAAVYRGFVSLIDAQVGRLSGCLEEEGVEGETVVIFCSDHGEMLGQHGLWHKMQPYEESVRVPLIVAGPGVEQGVLSEAPVSLIDLVPTICGLAGVEAPEECEGESVFEAGEGRLVFSEQEPLGEFHGEVAWRMVCEGRWKFVWNQGDRAELYDLEEDPGEVVNLAGEDGVKEVEEGLREALQLWTERTGDCALPRWDGVS